MKSNIINGALMAAISSLVTPGALQAQVDLPATQIGLVAFGNSSITVDDPAATQMEIQTHARYDYAVSAAPWLKPEIKEGKLVLNLDANPYSGSRTCTLSIRSAQSVVSELTVTQAGIDFASDAQEMLDAMKVRPVRVVSTSSQPGSGPELTIDGDYNSMWHSSYSGFNPDKQEEWPLLTYFFDNDGVEISSIRYVPRQSGTNGNFGVVKLLVGTPVSAGSSEYTWTDLLPETVDLKYSARPYVFKIPENKQKDIHAIRFQIQSGSGNYASCVEMEFFKSATSAGVDMSADYALFSDAVLSSLKPGVSAKEVDAMKSPFLKRLAKMMLSGAYSSEGRVSTHEPLWNVETLSDRWNAPGKFYDRTQGATGVMMTSGSYVVVVDGLDDHLPSVDLKVVGWNVPEDEYAREESFPLSNGINVVNRTSEWSGLAYVGNYNTEGIENGTARDVSVHIVAAPVNGVVSNTKTNAENQATLENAVYPCIDCVGSRVHSVWEVDALMTYAKNQYVRYVNVLDQLIIWEHRLLGLEKYDRVPGNKTLAYVNYDYYMYQGGRGVTFKYDTQYRVCNPDVLMTGDDDAIWGLSHEWGHQHQMNPYFKWTGMAEVTNNMFSAYNVLHMGYNVNASNYWGRFPKDKWQTRAPKIFLQDNYDRTPSAPDAESGETKTANSDGIVLALRKDAGAAAKAGNAYWWCNELKQFAINQPAMPSLRSEDPKRALNAIEAYSGNNGELILAPYAALMFYFSEPQTGRLEEDYLPDLWPDLFEALRQTDNVNGSSVEKQDGIDKYELLASAHNGNKSADPSINKIEQFRSKYPESVWTSHNYLPAKETLYWNNNSVPFILNFIRKASRLTNYNLWSYFERWGSFTVCAIEQGDYGIQHYVMTEEMYDEFKADMYALEKAGVVRPLPDNIREAISKAAFPTYNTPEIPNDRPLTADEN